MSLAIVAFVGSAAMALRLSGIWERLASWGVDPTVSASVLPGDDLVVDPMAVDTRTGEYSYSVFGLPHRKGAGRIVPEWQDLTSGDSVNEWVVRGLEPGRTLVLESDIAGSWSWAFVLEPLDGGSRTRLIERIRSRPALPRRASGAAMRVIGLIVLLMVRKQMLTIRDRAEGLAT